MYSKYSVITQGVNYVTLHKGWIGWPHGVTFVLLRTYRNLILLPPIVLLSLGALPGRFLETMFTDCRTVWDVY